jgi:hypothetical protein
MLYFHSHHKCASRWASAYLREVADLNLLSYAHDDKTDRIAPNAANFVFFGNSTYERSVDGKLWGVHFVRNPLNLIVSAYFSHLNTHPDTGWPELATQRRLLRSIGLLEGLYLTIAFLERADIGPGTAGPLHALRSWDYDDSRFKTVRIEDFVAAPSEAVREMLPLARPILPVDWRYAFEAFSGGRPPGWVNDQSHYRSGDPEEWRKHVPREIVAYVQATLPSLLAQAYPELLTVSTVSPGETLPGTRTLAASSAG